MSELKLTSQARADLRAIAHYTRRKWGLKQRDTYLRQLDTCLQNLAKIPDYGRPLDVIRTGLRGLDCQKHVICYRVMMERIEIIRILHQQQHLPSAFHAH